MLQYKYQQQITSSKNKHIQLKIIDSNLWEEQHFEMQKHNHYLQHHHDSTGHSRNILQHPQYQPAVVMMSIKILLKYLL